ncbi:MAG: FliM/FliN family flagellar motor switch protein, partial [Rhizobiaceae bacterium]|nr:FliM/FliN family flagellar motor switch protein [Rhizobiaceae bacterium]
RFNSEIMRSVVRLEATIPMGTLTLSRIAGLAVGEVIPMPKTAATDTRLSARGKTLYSCEFGKLGENFTVRIREQQDSGRDLINSLAAG